jgi:hypothetical protein
MTMLSSKGYSSTFQNAGNVSLQKVLKRGRPIPKAMDTPALDKKNWMLNVIDSALEIVQEGEVEVNGERTTNST